MSNKRTIFEDVSDGQARKAGPKGGMIASRRRSSLKGVRIWLRIMLILVALMIVIGGLTRLTDSGLSITEWKPVTGAIPPLNEATWQAEFDKYKEIPEYQLQNKGMSLQEFKSIYWWEWGHRQLGRTIGLVWALGFLWLLVRRRIPTGWTGRFLLLGVLGGAQGAIGWWMVSSGLGGRMVDVASYRLAIHLGLAFYIMGLLVWYRLTLKRKPEELLQARRNREKGLAGITSVLIVLIFGQIILGALVAGIDAGRGYIDWPLMNGEFLPSESFDYEPYWTNYFENPALVQFNHRMLGYLVLLVAIFTWLRSRRSAVRAVRRGFSSMMVLVLLQMVLGVVTVLYAAPVHAAITHQIGAILVMGFALRARFLALYPASQSLR